MLEKIIPQCVNAKRIFINGGEPLLAKLHLKLLQELINLDIAKNIELIYSTNLLLLESQHFEIWKNFKHVSLTISIDDVDERNKFIRFPSSWKEMQNKLNLVKHQVQNQQIKNISFNSWCTISFLNFAYLPEYLTFLKTNFDFLNISIRSIQSPAHLSPVNLPQYFKDTYAKEIFLTLTYLNLENLKNEIDFIVNSNDDPNLLKSGVEFVNHFAEFHKLQLENIF